MSGSPPVYRFALDCRPDRTTARLLRSPFHAAKGGSPPSEKRLP
ncbi:hypothetical protein [Thermacetogenium phaeum]|nr:hypothetical protein [Thermacetogenium phaeum]